jgi:hypothetical protein
MKNAKATTVIHIRVDTEVYEKVKKAAEAEDRKYGAQINRILRDWALKQEKKNTAQ